MANLQHQHQDSTRVTRVSMASRLVFQVVSVMSLRIPQAVVLAALHPDNIQRPMIDPTQNIM